MFIPIGFDQEEVRRTPVVSYAIIAINVAVFVVTTFFFLWSPLCPEGRLGPLLVITFGHLPVGALGFVPAHANALDSLVSSFVHSGLLHLAGNMLFLYLTGPFVEDAYGRPLFALLYLCSALVADATTAAQGPDSLIPSVGASGAIAGIMGAFLVRYFWRKIRFLWLPFFPFTLGSRQFYVRAFLYLPFWFLCQYAMALLVGNGSGVAVWAHVGGFLFGFGVALLIAIFGIERRFVRPSIEAEVSYTANADLGRAIEEGRQGHLLEARRATDRVLICEPKNVDARRLAYDFAVEFGDRTEIGRRAAALLELYISMDERVLARGFIREVLAQGITSLPSRVLLRAAEFLAVDGEAPRAIEIYELLARTRPEVPAALRALLQLAELRQKTGDISGAREALERARRHPECAGEWLELLRQREAALREPPLSAAGRSAPTALSL
jgi:membrane associated rhomboid family serine protease